MTAHHAFSGRYERPGYWDDAPEDETPDARVVTCANCRREIADDATRASDRSWVRHFAAFPRCLAYYEHT